MGTLRPRTTRPVVDGDHDPARRRVPSDVPFLAQGVGQAIEDAAALARCLSETSLDISIALARYETARRAHTAKIQRMSWDNNTFYHLPDGPEQRARDTALQAGAAGSGLEGLRWIYGSDPGTVAI